MQDPFKIPFEKLIATIQRVQPRLVHALGAEALAFIDDNFSRQAFQGTVNITWAQRKKKEKGALRKILVKTGTLRRSFRAEDGINYTTITTDVPWAKIHNEGGEIQHPGGQRILNFDRTPKNGRWRFGKVQTETQQRRIKQIRRATVAGYTIHMPERRFIGNSPVLTKRCRKALTTLIQEEIKRTR